MCEAGKGTVPRALRGLKGGKVYRHPEAICIVVSRQHPQEHLSRLECASADASRPSVLLFLGSRADPISWGDHKSTIQGPPPFFLNTHHELFRKEACWKVGYRGPVGGAWRALDHDLSGGGVCVCVCVCARRKPSVYLKGVYERAPHS